MSEEQPRSESVEPIKPGSPLEGSVGGSEAREDTSTRPVDELSPTELQAEAQRLDEQIANMPQEGRREYHAALAQARQAMDLDQGEVLPLVESVKAARSVIKDQGRLHPGLEEGLARKLEVYKEMPRISRADMKKGDELQFKMMNSDHQPCEMDFRIDKIKVDPDFPTEYPDVLVTITKNTSRSPLEVGKQYLMGQNAINPNGSMLDMKGDVIKGGYQLFWETSKENNNVYRSSFISDVTIKRGDETIRPFDEPKPEAPESERLEARAAQEPEAAESQPKPEAKSNQAIQMIKAGEALAGLPKEDQKQWKEQLKTIDLPEGPHSAEDRDKFLASAKEFLSSKGVDLDSEQKNSSEAKASPENIELSDEQAQLVTKDPDQVKKRLGGGKESADDAEFTRSRWGGGEIPRPPAPTRIPEVMTLIAQDSTETNRAMSILEGENQTTDRINELKERWAGRPESTGSKVRDVTRLVGRAIRHLPSFVNYAVQSNLMRGGIRARYIVEAHQEKAGIDYHTTLADQVARRVDVGDPAFGETLLQEDRPEVAAVKQELNNVFQRGVRGDIDRAAVLEQAKAVVARAPWIQNGSEEAIHIVQNVERIYDHVAAQVDHDAGIEAVNAAYRLVGGETTLGVNTETQRSATDRVMEKLTNSRLKSMLVNEATTALVVGGVIGVVTRIGRSTAGKVAGVAIGGALTGGALPALVGAAASAGVFAGLKERMTIRQERAGLAAELAMGGARVEGRSNVPRRAELEETIYDTVSAVDIMSNFNTYDLSSPENLTLEQANSLFGWAGTLTANIRLGVEQHMDLISYNSEGDIEAQKADLLDARAQAMAALEAYAAANPDAFNDVGGADLADKLNIYTERRIQLFQQGEIAQKDKAFRKLSRSRSLKRGVATAGFAAFASLAVQETREFFSGQPAYADTQPQAQTIENQHMQYGFKGDSINMPKDWHLEGNAIIDGNGNHIADNIKLTDDWRNWGALPPETIQQIKDHGFDVKVSTSIYEHTVDRTIPYNEYLAVHPEKVQDISRDLWLNNNTQRFDLNELRGDYKLDSSGNIILSTQRLTNNGSFWNNVAVEAHNNQVQGTLKWVLSNRVDQYTGQAQVLDVPPSGELVIPKGSPEYNLFRIDPDGSVHNNGSWAEIAVDSGKPHPGGERGLFILATQGENGPTPNVTITDTVKFPVTETTIIAQPTPPPPGIPPEIRFIPVAAPLPRNPVENLYPEEQDPEPTPEFGYGYGYNRSAFSPEFQAYALSRMSERLRNDPNANLNPAVEIPEYLSNLPVDAQALAAQLASEISEPMGEEVRGVITIPVAGSQEGKNIYNTLKWYTGQVDSDGQPINLGSFEIVLYVNKTDNVDWDETPAEIERFIADYPEMPIRVISHSYPGSDLLYGEMHSDMVNAVLHRSQQRGAVNSDFQIITNDADLKGLGQTYVYSMINGADINNTDAAASRLEFSPAPYQLSPLYHASELALQMINVVERYPTTPQTQYPMPGPSTSIKASMYAALGGEPRDINVGPDTYLKLAVRLARNREGGLKKPIAFMKGDAVLYTDSRRGVVAFNNGVSPASQWTDMEFSANQEDIRAGQVIPRDDIDYTVLFADTNSPAKAREQQRFLATLSDMVTQTAHEYGYSGAEVSDYSGSGGAPQDVQTLTRFLRSMRLYYEDEGGARRDGFIVRRINGKIDIQIYRADKLFDYLKRYQTTGLERFSRRVGLDRLFPGGTSEVFPELATT